LIGLHGSPLVIEGQNRTLKFDADLDFFERGLDEHDRTASAPVSERYQQTSAR
jgi:hypothetical protein